MMDANAPALYQYRIRNLPDGEFGKWITCELDLFDHFEKLKKDKAEELGLEVETRKLYEERKPGLYCLVNWDTRTLGEGHSKLEKAAKEFEKATNTKDEYHFAVIEVVFPMHPNGLPKYAKTLRYITLPPLATLDENP